MGPEQAGEENEETAIGLEANVALVIKDIIKGIDKLLRGVSMEDAVRKGVSEMHTPSSRRTRSSLAFKHAQIRVPCIQTPRSCFIHVFRRISAHARPFSMLA